MSDRLIAETKAHLGYQESKSCEHCKYVDSHRDMQRMTTYDCTVSNIVQFKVDPKHFCNKFIRASK